MSEPHLPDLEEEVIEALPADHPDQKQQLRDQLRQKLRMQKQQRGTLKNKLKEGEKAIPGFNPSMLSKKQLHKMRDTLDQTGQGTRDMLQNLGGTSLETLQGLQKVAQAAQAVKK